MVDGPGYTLASLQFNPPSTLTSTRATPDVSANATPLTGRRCPAGIEAPSRGYSIRELTWIIAWSDQPWRSHVPGWAPVTASSAMTHLGCFCPYTPGRSTRTG